MANFALNYSYSRNTALPLDEDAVKSTLSEVITYVRTKSKCYAGQLFSVTGDTTNNGLYIALVVGTEGSVLKLATQESLDLVASEAGKIDKIFLNGTELTINNKTVSIDLSDYATVSFVCEKISEIEEPAQEVPVENEVAETLVEADELQNEETPENIVEGVEAVETIVPAEPIETETQEEEIVAEDVESEKVDSDNLEELPAEETEVLPEDEVAPEPFVEDELPAEEVPVEEETETEDVVAKEEFVEETPVENVSSIDSPVVTEEPEVESGLLTEAETESDSEAYEPIILVPAEPNPPVVEEETAEKTEVAPETTVSTEPAETKDEVAEETVPTPTIEKSTNVVTEKADEYDFEKYTVPSIKQLKSKSYYVQIAVLSDKANIKVILDKYSSKYPITLVPMASGKATQVLVGPLSVDEYGTVLNRFKAYGYKDAFLRKIR